MKNNHKKHSGFTLVEMIISMALFAICMTPIYSVLISTMNHNKNGEIKQTAALHGQEIFEEVKNEKIEPLKDEDGKSIGISKIGDIDISPSTNKGTKSFDGGYEATVTIRGNTSITLDKEITSGVKTSDFTVNLIGAASPIEVNGEDLEYDTTLNEPLKLVINTKTTGNKKVIVIKDSYNNIIITDELEVDADNEDNQIKIIVNFDEYEALSKDLTKFKIVEVSVYNQDDIPLNLCLQKSTDLDVKIYTKLGNVRTYDNRSGTASNLGELYDINVEVTQKINNKTNTIFTGKTSQNINVN